jgi:DNA-binding MarR family transcriptional regulator
MKAKIPKNCTNFKARRLARLLSRHYDAELGRIGLKTTQFTLLTHLVNVGSLSQGELAARMGLEASTLTRNLRSVVDNGWVIQVAGADARSRAVAITAAGKSKQIEADRFWNLAQKSVDTILGQERVDALNSMLDECSKLLQ